MKIWLVQIVLCLGMLLFISCAKKSITYSDLIELPNSNTLEATIEMAEKIVREISAEGMYQDLQEEFPYLKDKNKYGLNIRWITRESLVNKSKAKVFIEISVITVIEEKVVLDHEKVLIYCRHRIEGNIKNYFKEEAKKVTWELSGVKNYRT